MGSLQVSRRGIWAGIASSLLLIGAAGAEATDLGAAGIFGILGFENVKISMSHAASGVTGDLGLGPGGIQNFSEGFIDGTYFVDPTANNEKSNNVVISGGVVIQDLSQAVADARAAAAVAAAQVPTQSYGVIKDALTISGTGSGGFNVISIESIRFSDSSDKLTFDGTADDTFIVQVSGVVSLTHKLSAIQVSGGVRESRVLFVLTGSGTPLSISGGAHVVGTYLVPAGKVTLSPGTVTGAVLAGDDISLPSGGNVQFVPFDGAVDNAGG
jgi:hypothetical protein